MKQGVKVEANSVGRLRKGRPTVCPYTKLPLSPSLQHDIFDVGMRYIASARNNSAKHLSFLLKIKA